jgi:hypothetical protein
VGIFAFPSCKEDSTTETKVPYTVSISGNIIRLFGSTLDSVKFSLSKPQYEDSANSAGVFQYSISASATADVEAVIKFTRSGYADTSRQIIYGPRKQNIVLEDIKMRMSGEIIN